MKKLINISEPFNDIFLAENFISEEDRLILLNFAKISSEDDWSIRYKKDRYIEASLNNPEKNKNLNQIMKGVSDVKNSVSGALTASNLSAEIEETKQEQNARNIKLDIYEDSVRKENPNFIRIVSEK